MLNPAGMARFLEEKLRALGTAACPPYHLAIVVGGTSAEYALKTAKYASARYLDTLPQAGLGRRARVPRPASWSSRCWRSPGGRGSARSSAASTSATTCGSSGCPGTARPARSPSRCPARRTGRRCGEDHRRTACSWSGWRPTRPGTCRRPPTTDLASDDVVRVDLARPMDEIRAELSKYPVKTRLALTGPWWSPGTSRTRRSRNGWTRASPCRDYLRDHAVYYAGPAKTPEGYASGSFGPTTAGRMDSYVDSSRRPAGRWSCWPRATAPPRSPPRAASTAASTWARSAGPRPGWPGTASPRWRCWSTRSSAWRRSGGSRCGTSRPSSSSTTRATTSSPTSTGPLLTIGRS